MWRQRVSIMRLSAFLVLGLLTSMAFAQVSVNVEQHDEHGAYLVDGDGMSLYVFLPDDEEDEASACYDDCAEAWPPLTTEDEVEASEDVDAELLGTIERTDGAQQVTYDGWPLYYFVQDEEPGDAQGQGAGENWYLVSPEGEAVGAASTGESNAMGEMLEEGATVYRSTCAGCHGAEGATPQGQAVRLAGNDRAVRDGSGAIMRVLYGGQYMPQFGDQLSNEEVAAVVTYIRNSWGNDFGSVTREEVVEVRQQFE